MSSGCKWRRQPPGIRVVASVLNVQSEITAGGPPLSDNQKICVRLNGGNSPKGAHKLFNLSRSQLTILTGLLTGCSN